MTQPTTRASSQPTSTPQQPSPDLLFAPSLAAHLSLSTINGARLIGCKGVRYCGSRSGRQQGRQQQETAEGGGLWGMGGLFGQLGKKKQSSGKVERSVGLQELEAAIAGTAAGGTNAAVTEANKGVSPDDKEMVGRLQGLWRDVLEGGEEGVERADYADIEAPIKRMFVDGPSSVTLLDRPKGHLTSLDLNCHFAYTDPLPPPVHTFPSLRSLSLLFVPAHHRCIALCSSLTSLALWHPDAFALHSLASPSTPLHRSLTSLTIHNAWLETALTPLASLPRLASLSFLSCTIDPCDLHALARSLHTLTHLASTQKLAVHHCPMIPSHSLAALAESNPALASLSLHSTSHFLFIARGLRDLFLSSSSRLHTLTLSGLPSYRPGMLARCSSLQCLTLRGREAARGSILPSESPQKPSLDCIVAMLVRVEQLGAPEGPEGGGDGVERWKGAMVGENGGRGSTAASPAAAAAAGEAETEDEAEAMTAEAKEGDEAVSPAAAATPVVCSSRRRRYVDLRKEAAAGRAEFVAAMDNWMALTKTSKWKLKKAATEALRWRRLHHRVGALDFISQAVVQVLSAILLCRCVRLAKAEMKGWSAREAALAKACRAAEAAGIFTAAVEEEVEEEEGVEPERDDEEGRGGQGIDAEEVVRYMPEDDLEDDLAAVSEKLLAWVAVPRADARELLHALMELLLLEMEDMGARFEIHDPAQPHPTILPGLVIVPALAAVPGAAAGGLVTAAAGAGAAAAVPGPAVHGTAEGAAAEGAAAEGAAAEGAAAEGAAAEGAAAEGAAAEGAAAEGMAAEGTATEGTAAQDPRSAQEEARGAVGEDVRAAGAFEQLPRAKQLGGRSSTRPPPQGSAPPKKSTVSKTSTLATPVEVLCPPLESLTLDSIRFTFESLARAAVCGRLKSLALLNCCGLEEGQLEELLRACGMLEDLRVQGCDGFSGSVIAGSRLEVLNRLSVVGCGGITADAIGRLLGNVPRLQYLEVEGDKVSERARRELLRAGVVVRGVSCGFVSVRCSSKHHKPIALLPSPSSSPLPPFPLPPFSFRPSLSRLPPFPLSPFPHGPTALLRGPRTPPRARLRPTMRGDGQPIQQSQRSVGAVRPWGHHTEPIVAASDAVESQVRKPIKYTVGLARTKSPWTWGISTIEPPMKIYVGDTLEFKWASPNTVDDVVQLFSKASWTSCALASKSERLAAQAKKGTVAYKIPDKYRGMWVYFASSAGIDCAKGQKFKVFVN
ncbi:unnamed protein product [Closterium sp. NIES-65]|nr:unnamed protein product [Closterium sp. NIES-65]